MSKLKTIAIANQKGGEGKTTTAINLSHGLALEGNRTLLIDIDPQANSSGIFTDVASLENTIAELFKNQVEIKSLIVKTQYDKLDLLPSKISLAEIELGSVNVEAPYLLRDAIVKIENDYDFIVIDCPPSLSIFTVNALVASNYVIVPLQAEKFSIDGIKGLQSTIESIKRRINPDLEILGALITQLKNNTILTKTILPVIQNYFPVFDSSISVSVSIGESHLSRQTLFDYNPNLKQTKEYLSFVKEVLSGIQK